MELHKKWNKSKSPVKILHFPICPKQKTQKPETILFYESDSINYRNFVQDDLHILLFFDGNHSLMLRYALCYSEANLLKFQITTNNVFNSQKRTPIRTLNRTWSPIPPTLMPRLISR